MRETDKVGYGKVIETKKKHYICIFLTRIQENPDFCGKRKNIYIYYNFPICISKDPEWS